MLLYCCRSLNCKMWLDKDVWLWWMGGLSDPLWGRQRWKMTKDGKDSERARAKLKSITSTNIILEGQRYRNVRLWEMWKGRRVSVWSSFFSCLICLEKGEDVPCFSLIAVALVLSLAVSFACTWSIRMLNILLWYKLSPQLCRLRRVGVSEETERP